MNNSKRHQSFLATSSQKFLKVGFALAIALVILAFELPIYSNGDDFPPLKGKEIEVMESSMIFNHTVKKEVPPAEPPKEFKPNATIVVDDILPNELIPVKEPTPILDDKDLGLSDIGKDLSAIDEVDPPVDFATVMPNFPGGESELLKYLNKTPYSNYAIENDIQGTVHIRFVVDKKGTISKEEVLRGVHPLLDKEALEMVRNMPKWTPGEQNGRKVNVRIVVPFKFILRN